MKQVYDSKIINIPVVNLPSTPVQPDVLTRKYEVSLYSIYVSLVRNMYSLARLSQ